MALSIVARTQYQKLNFVAKHLSFIFKSFATTANPKSFNLSYTYQSKHTCLANLLQRYDFFAKNRFLLNSNVSELEECMEILLVSLKVQQNLIVSLVCSCPSVLELGFLKKWEVGILSLGTLVKSSRMVCSVLEYSRRFGIDPHGFCRCVQGLRGFGFSDGTIGKVLEEFPGVVMIDDRELKRRMDFWAMLGMEREHIDVIYNSFPGVLGFGVENRLKPLVNENREEILREPGFFAWS